MDLSALDRLCFRSPGLRTAAQPHRCEDRCYQRRTALASRVDSSFPHRYILTTYISGRKRGYIESCAMCLRSNIIQIPKVAREVYMCLVTQTSLAANDDCVLLGPLATAKECSPRSDKLDRRSFETLHRPQGRWVDSNQRL